MQRNNRRRRSCSPVCKNSTPTLRTPKTSNLRQRPSIYSSVYARTPQSARHRIELQHCIPPTDRWTIRTNKSVARTVPQDVREPPQKRLVTLVAFSTIHTQLLAKRNNKENTI